MKMSFKFKIEGNKESCICHSYVLDVLCEFLNDIPSIRSN